MDLDVAGLPSDPMSRAESILDALDRETPEPDNPESAVTQTADAAPETEPQAQEDQSVADTEPKVPAIEAPAGLTDDERSAWASLPRQAQEIIARRERDRTSELRRGQDEIATTKKAIEQERQKLAATADQFAQLAQTVDPVLAEGYKTDWAKLAQENPAEYVAKRAAFEQHHHALQSALHQRNAAQAQQQQEYRAEQAKRLVELIPEWKDPARYQKDWNDIVTDATKTYGFDPQELGQLSDARQYKVLADAKAYRDLKAAQVSAAAKQVKPVPRVMRPGNANEGGQGGRAEALLKQARGVRDPMERAELIARAATL